MERSFFIVGSPRSGTTLLRRMLDGHSQIVVTPETHFGASFFKRRERFGPRGSDAARAALLDAFCDSPGFRRLHIDEGAFKAEASARPSDPWWPLATAMRAFGELRQKPIVGEKTPSHALYMQELVRRFPEARFVLLWRDPRAVVVSMERVEWSSRSAEEVSEIWRRYSKAMRIARASWPERCVELRYEELVSNPRETLSTLCRFLELEFESGMLDYPDRDESFADETRDIGLTVEPPRAERIEAWRSSLSRASLRRVEAICWVEMRRMGYARESGIIERLLAAIAVLPLLWWRRIRRRLKAFRRG